MMNRRIVSWIVLVVCSTTYAAPKLWFETADNQVISLTPRQVKQFNTLQLMVGDIQQILSSSDEPEEAVSSKEDPFPIANVTKQEMDILLALAAESIHKRLSELKDMPALLADLPPSKELNNNNLLVRVIKAAHFLDARTPIVTWLNRFFQRQIRQGAITITADVGFAPAVDHELAQLLIEPYKNDILLQACQMNKLQYKKLFSKDVWKSYDYASYKKFFVIPADDTHLNLVSAENGKVFDQIDIQSPVTHFRVNNKGTLLFTSRDHELIIWDLSTKKKIVTENFRFKINDIAPNDKGTALAIAGEHAPGLYKRSKGSEHGTFERIANGITDIQKITIDSAGEYVAFPIKRYPNFILYDVRNHKSSLGFREGVTEIFFDSANKCFALIQGKNVIYYNYQLEVVESLSGNAVTRQIANDLNSPLSAHCYSSGKVQLFLRKDLNHVGGSLFSLPDGEPITYIQFFPEGFKLMVVSNTSVGVYSPETMLNDLKQLPLEQSALLERLGRAGYQADRISAEDKKGLVALPDEVKQVIMAMIKNLRSGNGEQQRSHIKLLVSRVFVR